MVLVDKKAPDFCSKAVIENKIVDDFKLSDYRGKYVVLFFYPLDFTFVCPTELHAFQEKIEDFDKKNVQIIAVSTDSWFSHLAWVKTHKTQGGIQGVTYPLVSDFNKTISRDYGILIEDMGVALRGLFLIDKEGLVQHQVVNNLPLGRSVDEVLRMVDALQFTEKYGEVCPANWNKDKKSIKADEEGLKEYFSSA
jgi:peroxiredoxin (alkyl hydroperoxide reductase subunit C)